MEKTEDFFSPWIQAQEQALAGLRQQAELLRSFSQAGGTQNPFESWHKVALDAFMAGADAKVAQETLSSAFAGSGVFHQLYEIWQPLLQAMQSKAFSTETGAGLFDPARVQALVDQLFKFDADALAQLQQQITQFTTLLSSQSEHFGKPWAEAMQHNLQSLPQLALGRPELLMQSFHQLFNAFDSTFGRGFHVPAVGKDREKLELMSRCIDDLSVYAAKNVEYQHQMYLAGVAAMQETIAALAAKVEADEPVQHFDDFFDLWITSSEKSYYALFQTRDYAQLTGELLDAGLNVRKHYFKLMEIYLFDLPIALRSEMDDLYKTIYQMRKQLKQLQARMKEASV